MSEYPQHSPYVRSLSQPCSASKPKEMVNNIRSQFERKVDRESVTPVFGLAFGDLGSPMSSAPSSSCSSPKFDRKTHLAKSTISQAIAFARIRSDSVIKEPPSKTHIPISKSLSRDSILTNNNTKTFNNCMEPDKTAKSNNAISGIRAEKSLSPSDSPVIEHSPLSVKGRVQAVLNAQEKENAKKTHTATSHVAAGTVKASKEFWTKQLSEESDTSDKQITELNCTQSRTDSRQKMESQSSHTEKTKSNRRPISTPTNPSSPLSKHKTNSMFGVALNRVDKTAQSKRVLNGPSAHTDKPLSHASSTSSMDSEGTTASTSNYYNGPFEINPRCNLRRKDTKPPERIVARRTQLFEKSLDDINANEEEASAYSKMTELGTAFLPKPTIPSKPQIPKLEPATKSTKASIEGKGTNSLNSDFRNSLKTFAHKSDAVSLTNAVTTLSLTTYSSLGVFHKGRWYMQLLKC